MIESYFSLAKVKTLSQFQNDAPKASNLVAARPVVLVCIYSHLNNFENSRLRLSVQEETILQEEA